MPLLKGNRSVPKSDFRCLGTCCDTGADRSLVIQAYTAAQAAHYFELRCGYPPDFVNDRRVLGRCARCYDTVVDGDLHYGKPGTPGFYCGACLPPDGAETFPELT